jgi:predicted transport protein
MFSNYQQEAVNFKDLPFELWEVKRFDNDTLYFNPIKAPKNAQSIQTVQITNAVVQGIHKEIKVYSEEDQLAAVNDEIKELYAQIRSYTLGLDDIIDIKPKKLEIGFRYNQKIFLDIHLQKRAIKLWLNLRQGELDDPKKLTKNVKETGHWGNGDYELHFSNDENIEYIFSLIKQAYKKKRS